MDLVVLNLVKRGLAVFGPQSDESAEEQGHYLGSIISFIDHHTQQGPASHVQSL